MIGLNSIAGGPRATAKRPGDVFDGAAQAVQALLADQLAHDVATLATVNQIIAARRPTAPGDQTADESPPDSVHFRGAARAVRDRPARLRYLPPARYRAERAATRTQTSRCWAAWSTRPATPSTASCSATCSSRRSSRPRDRAGRGTPSVARAGARRRSMARRQPTRAGWRAAVNRGAAAPSGGAGRGRWTMSAP